MDNFKLFKVPVLVNLEDFMSKTQLKRIIIAGFGHIISEIISDDLDKSGNKIFEGFQVGFPDQISKDKMSKYLKMSGLGQTDFRGKNDLQLNIFI